MVYTDRMLMYTEYLSISDNRQFSWSDYIQSHAQFQCCIAQLMFLGNISFHPYVCSQEIQRFSFHNTDRDYVVTGKDMSTYVVHMACLHAHHCADVLGRNIRSSPSNDHRWVSMPWTTHTYSLTTATHSSHLI